MTAEKLWTKSFILATVSGFFTAVVFYISLTTLARYTALTFQANASLAGLAASIFVLGSVFGRIFSGRYMELIGRRKLLLTSQALFFFTSLAYPLPLNLAGLMALRFWHGLTFGVVNNALAAIVINFIPKKRLGEGIGYFSLNFTAATALGPFLGLYAVRHWGYPALFWICSGSALLALLFIGLVKIENPAFSPEQLRELKNKPLKDTFEKGVLPMAYIIFIMGLCYTGVTAFLDSYAVDLKQPEAASMFFIVYGAAIVVFRPLAGKLLDRKGDNIVMMPALFFFAAALLALSMADGLTVFALAAVLMALGFGNILNIGQAIAAKTVPPHRIGTATSTYFIFSDSGYGLGPLLMGLIVTWGGFSRLYLVEAALVALALPL